MKKAVIFDLDNTLIMWKDEYVQELCNLLEKHQIKNVDNLYKKVDSYIEDYEKKHQELTKEKLCNYINENCNLNLDVNFIDELIDAQGNCFVDDKKLVETIKYLATKYDLYVVTNWFTKTQKKRLENVGILSYFKEVYGSDTNYLKPDPKCFDCILKDYPSNDCIYVGDNFENDILMPSSLGMDVYWVSSKPSSDYKTIKNVYELKELL